MIVFTEKLSPVHLLEGRVPDLVEDKKAADDEKQSSEVVKKVLSMLIDELGGNVSFSLGTYLSSRSSRERMVSRPRFYDGAPENSNLREAHKAGTVAQKAKALPTAGAEKQSPKGNQKGGMSSPSDPERMPAACKQHKKLLHVAERLAQLFGRPIEEISKLLGLEEAAKPKLGSGKRFAQLQKSLTSKGVKNAGALAAAIGREKWGKGRFQKLAAKGKK